MCIFIDTQINKGRVMMVEYREFTYLYEMKEFLLRIDIDEMRICDVVCPRKGSTRPLEAARAAISKVGRELGRVYITTHDKSDDTLFVKRLK